MPREIVIIQKTEGKPPDRFDRFERVSKMLSVAAIPIAIAVGGWLIQSRIEDQAVKRDYVQLAVSILTQPDTVEVRQELRAWAVELLNAHSPTKLAVEIKRQLETGEATLPAGNEPARYSHGARPLDDLQPAVAQLARRLLNAAREQGIELAVVRTYVTPEEQDSLYARGRTRPGSIVTNLRGGQTAHNRGLAFDVVPVVNGELDWANSELFERVGALGTALGLTWGGDFRFRDLPHFELRQRD